ncbi:MAG: M28 family peptidase [Firmicutes bacterium]|nr:M28 family peptidase [Bacillota bacterium]
MRKIGRLRLISILIGLLFLISCTEETVRNNNDYSIEETCEYLASNELEGRLTGTKGNEMAMEYIEQYFDYLGLDKFENNSYRQEYTHEFYNPDSQQYNITFKDNNRVIKKGIYGKDFLPQMVDGDINTTYPITFNIDDKNIENSAIVIDNQKDFQKVFNKAKLILSKKENFKKYLINNLINNREQKVIQISEELYDLLKEEQGSITVEFKLDKEEIIDNNLVGIIKGNDGKNAIVLSAHFDHVGAIDDKVFNGALDNSSGVSSLLSIAKQLKEYSNDNSFSNDIIICAFNGEESGLQGSKSFVNKIKNKYEKILNINIDCIGGKNAKQIDISSDTDISGILQGELITYFNNVGYDCDISYGMSDHASFDSDNMIAISVIQRDLDVIHTDKDTSEKLDYESILDISKRISNYIIENEKDIFENLYNLYNEQAKDRKNSVEDNHEEVYDIIEKEKQELKLNQYKLIEINGDKQLITNGIAEFDNVDEMKKYFTNMNILRNIDGHSFYKSTVFVDNSEKLIDEKTNIEKMKVNEVYEFEKLSKDNIGFLVLEYINSDHNNEILEFNINVERKDFDKESILNNNDLIRKTINIDGQQYYLVSTKKKGQILRVETEYASNNRQYYVAILKKHSRIRIIDGKEREAYLPLWLDVSEDEIIEYIRESDMNNVIGEILNY